MKQEDGHTVLVHTPCRRFRGEAQPAAETICVAHKHSWRTWFVLGFTAPRRHKMHICRGPVAQPWHLLGAAWLFRQPCLAVRLDAVLCTRFRGRCEGRSATNHERGTAAPSPAIWVLLASLCPKGHETPASLVVLSALLGTRQIIRQQSVLGVCLAVFGLSLLPLLSLALGLSSSTSLHDSPGPFYA